MHLPRKLWPLAAGGAVAALVLSLWQSSVPSRAASSLNVVATVAPLANIALNVGGSRISLVQLIPDGTDSHTFEPSPGDAKALAGADLIVINGLHLEGSTLKMAQANKKST